MSAKRKNIKSNLKKVDHHTITSDEYHELPELTDDVFERAVYKVHGIEKSAPKRRGPQKTPTKIAISLRLPREVVDYFKSEGTGWQTSMGRALKDWIKHHPHSTR